jgi:WD40 repeat protein
LLTRLGIQADAELAAFIDASRREIGRLEQERAAALLTGSRFLAEFTRQRNEASDFGTALAIGLEAIPDATEAIGAVVAPEAVFELERAVRSVRERYVLRGHQGLVRSAVFDPAGARVLTASDDRTARLWDAASGTELAALRGHRGRVLSAVFDPDGGRVLTASDDRTARLWDAASGAELTVLRGHEDWVLSAVFDPDAACVLTTSSDGMARIWRLFLSTAALVEYARTIMPRPLTPQQR